MEKLTSILVVVDPRNEMYRTLGKALMLARQFGANLELFLCDSQRAFVLKHSYVTQEVERAWRESAGRAQQQDAGARSLCTDDLEKAREIALADGMKYMQALKDSLNASDVNISIDVACHSPLYEAIVHKVLETSTDLVIKTAAGRHPMRRLSLDENDWSLARTCPATLMLTGEHKWRERPRFAAAIDVSENVSCSLARMIAHSADFLAAQCDGELDLLYSEPKHADFAKHVARRETLRQLASEHEVTAEHTHVLQGDAEETLPKFAASQSYDVLVLGALTRRRGVAALVGSLTSELVDSLDCDFVLVKPANFEQREAENLPADLCPDSRN
jgi:universal stress protein E